MKLKLILSLVLIAAVAIVVGYTILKGKAGPAYEFSVAERGNISQEVSLTGQVLPAKKIDLQFEVNGRIKKIISAVGDRVKDGEILMTLEAQDLNSQVLEAEAKQEAAQAKLDKLLAGASREAIQVQQTAVENAEMALSNSRNTLKNYSGKLQDAKAQAESDLNQDYEDGLDALNSNYTAADQALKTFATMKERYFYFTDGTSRNVADESSLSQAALTVAKTAIDRANSDPDGQNIESGLSGLKSALDKSRQALNVMRSAMEEAGYKNAVSSTDKASVDTERANIDAAVSAITAAQQAISSQKIDNQVAINEAQRNVDSAQDDVYVAQGALKASQDKLAELKAPARPEDVDLARAELKQAQAVLSLKKQQLGKASLRSPIEGLVTDILCEQGEAITTQQVVASIISAGDLQVETDIPETEIVQVQVGDPARITLDAFPETVLAAKVVSLEPAERIIQGVVYYRARLAFSAANEQVKSGMTAVVDIVTEEKQGVLLIPQRAVSAKNGRKTARLLRGGEVEEVEVETGIRDSQGMIEIISGLNEGDEVITFVKQK